MRTIDVNGVEVRLPIKAVDHIDARSTQLTSGQIVVAYAAYDDNCSNPLEDCDGLGKIIEHRRQVDADETSKLLEESHMIVPLSKFEHGNVVWGVMGSLGNTPDFRWDGTSFAGRWEPDGSCIEHIKSSAIKKLLPDGVKVFYHSRHNADGTCITRPPKPGEKPYLNNGMMVDERYSNIITLTMPDGYRHEGYKSWMQAYQSAARRLKVKFDKASIFKGERLAADECAQQACDTFTSWCNGDCHGWVVAWFNKDGD